MAVLNKNKLISYEIFIHARTKGDVKTSSVSGYLQPVTRWPQKHVQFQARVIPIV